MPTLYLAVLIGFGGLFIGVLLGIIIRKILVKGKVKSAEARAEKILKDAKEKEQEVLISAKEKALKTLEESKRETEEDRREIRSAQQRLEARENKFDKKLLELEDTKTKLEQQKADVLKVRDDIEAIREEQKTKLQQVAGLSKDQAREELFKAVEENSKEVLLNRIHKLEQDGEEELDKKAQKMLSLAIQRFASSHVVDTTTTLVELPNDEMKGRIIGKEGRNIKTLERLTGCELIIDDTPEMITISGFSPVRRQVAKRSLEMLIKDGRIQPARIEDAVNQAKKELAKEMKKAGEDALYELGIPVSSIDPKLVSILGRLKFRTSYGQNVLQHSIEVARISGMLADELGADAFECKKGGLFHDIGKAVDHDMQGAHPQIGYNIMKKFGFPEEMCYQSVAHHEDKPKTLSGVIVKAADAISGARPGARRSTIEEYITRLQNLEDTAMGFEGVEKAYAIQAGREVRVFVEPGQIDDYGAHELAKNIAKKIESELTYPGEVKVTVIRETRTMEYAR
ncbi:ribonuclease Y [Candidatus Uhrbacteria bacterium CG_4_9_14_0_2_um_filter_41_50]|uniref:Ribonuclease Y n=1 Tax=Candidatus Uhrbacteria bacterium CG_4_9_14_0_2_um_filter_41_50 TaxID=1975031 RepID=A0A2M8EQ49_9BACT|nr:MAG: ribonuclease Y [Candidatus Uhrbacteria bacterium CG_4_10_14_3_um_filter_41_21]PIZ54417.1 MAG: ribonuclease Y [Candidatus Uhrbacteria bacterium CG_4_10_14_0_2_um_filter_41_21]PJB85028.1 MAG: ribonuclease Y [Candidatus Uhrbacteria bacterium CG_4_9_14_0_8_um_filter_41_16]PJC24821.1 MAG: ribonuclease Y [Candidatus Uhrbacteria bacterium CG_4_9_14_0_2_um_filter_41_50]PJE74948.1 MAG: ribonuclease Y [Candidatus Uhrbacteria bacterium CG10_big_fil_rev_8_21_14_0_10_41_26]